MERSILIFCRDKEYASDLAQALGDSHVKKLQPSSNEDLLMEILSEDYDALIYDLAQAVPQDLKMVRIIKRIRPKIGLVVISDNPSTDIGGKILEEGVAYYGVKPVNPVMIRQALDHYVLR